MNPSITHGAFSWSELMTADPSAAVKFYGRLLGWTDQVVPMPQGDYHLQMIDDRPVAGIMALPESDVPTTWVYYVTVNDVDRIAERAVELGGRIEVPAMDIPSIGRFCGLLDPQGAFFHIIRYEDPAEGSNMPDVEFADSFATHGAFSWFQLQTSDPAAAAQFYGALLGWKIVEDQMPSGLYRTLRVGGCEMGGIMQIWESGIPPHWSGYVTVDDADATAAAAEDAGGAIVVPPTDIPGVGRFATVQDPTGAMGNIISYVSIGEEA